MMLPIEGDVRRSASRASRERERMKSATSICHRSWHPLALGGQFRAFCCSSGLNPAPHLTRRCHEVELERLPEVKVGAHYPEGRAGVLIRGIRPGADLSVVLGISTSAPGVAKGNQHAPEEFYGMFHYIAL